MKKITLFLVLLPFIHGFSQEAEENLTIDKGLLSLTGSASLNFRSSESEGTYNDTEINTTSFTIAPHLGYLIKNNVQIGLGFRFAHNKNEHGILSPVTNTYVDYTSNSLGVSPYIRFYKGIGKQVSLYLQGEVNYDRIWNTVDDPNLAPNNEAKGYNAFLGIRPGLTYFIDQKWALETSIGALGYSFNKVKYEDGRNSKSDNFSLNLDASNIYFGISYYFQ